MTPNDYKRLIVSGSLEHGLRYNTHRRVINWPWVIVGLIIALVVMGYFFGG